MCIYNSIPTLYYYYTLIECIRIYKKKKYRFDQHFTIWQAYTRVLNLNGKFDISHLGNLLYNIYVIITILYYINRVNLSTNYKYNDCVYWIAVIRRSTPGFKITQQQQLTFLLK